MPIPWARPSLAGEPSPLIKQKCCSCAGSWGSPVRLETHGVSQRRGSLWVHPVANKLETSMEVQIGSPQGTPRRLMDAKQQAAGQHYISSQAGSSPLRAPCLGTAQSQSPVSPSQALLPNSAASCPLGMVVTPHLIEFPGHHSLSLQLRGTIALPATPRSPRRRRG